MSIKDVTVITHAPHLSVYKRPESTSPKVTPAEPLRPPNAIEMAENFTKAMLNWTARGMPVVTKEKYQSRIAVCNGCEFWDAKGNLGLGKCLAPKCGCTKMKMWLETEKCPIGKW